MRFVRCTLVQVVKGGKILLGMKKRGFGVGKWNGFGGKVEPGETDRQSAIRELHEECGLTVQEKNLVQLGVLLFEFVGENFLLEVTVFKTVSFSGSIVESDEMKPCWFAVDQIPFKAMWADDQYWYPLMLKDKMFYGFMKFQGHDTILEKDLKVVSNAEEMTALNQNVLKQYTIS